MLKLCLDSHMLDHQRILHQSGTFLRDTWLTFGIGIGNKKKLINLIIKGIFDSIDQ